MTVTISAQVDLAGASASHARLLVVLLFSRLNLQRKKRFDEATARGLATVLLETLSHLHGLGVVHRESIVPAFMLPIHSCMRKPAT